ncbi:reverse transcriptase domain-containing protein [Sulfobacillus sp. hq2]|uniref:reverse transcriptase domain-containing protein n=2 Tax=Sulfobacillus TaxID=28033 RepID=UPI001FA82113|nr:reverse transcriptase domain-containing protein [Sulfobacillus sp. hq2]
MSDDRVKPGGPPQAPSGSSASGVSTPDASTRNLMDAILDGENLKRALRRVRANQGVPGVDGVSTEEFMDYLREHWLTIRTQLREGTYYPQPIRGVEIPKPTGGVRMLGIPTVVDRFIQQAILQVLTPFFDPTFSDLSFGFRPGAVRTKPCAKPADSPKAGPNGSSTSTWRSSSTGLIMTS